jgi:hypothetical protein
LVSLEQELSSACGSRVTFSLATQRESDSVAEGDRSLLALNAQIGKAAAFRAEDGQIQNVRCTE